MLPPRTIWRSWSHLERASYLAQIAAELTLLATSVFSYLTLRKSQLARRDQQAYFLGEKAPEVVLTECAVVSDFLIFTLKNEGESIAKGVTFTAVAQDNESELNSLTGDFVDFLSNRKNPFNLQKGKSSRSAALDVEFLKSVINFKAKSCRKLESPRIF